MRRQADRTRPRSRPRSLASRHLRLMPFGDAGRVVFGRTPPLALSKDLLGRMIACRLQERVFGGLDSGKPEVLGRLGAPRRLTPAPAQTRARCSFATIRANATPSPSCLDGFDWQGTTLCEASPPSARAHHRHGPGVDPRFFALAPRNGTSAPGNTKRSARGDRNGSQPARRIEQGIAALGNRVALRKPEAIGVGYASLLERLSQARPGLLSDCAPCGVARAPSALHSGRSTRPPAIVCASSSSMKRPAKPVAPEHKSRGYEVAKGHYLIVEDAELEAIEIREYPHHRDRQLCAAV